MQWSEEQQLKLRQLWQEGISTADIARRMGTSKNAVVGKAHRLNLPPRPSPIVKGSGASRRPRLRVGPVTLPPLESISAPPPSEIAHMQEAPLPPAPRKLSARQVARTEKIAAGEPERPKSFRQLTGRVSDCCWPIGEPGRRDFRFCSDQSLPGRPYCEAHCRLAYTTFDQPSDMANDDLLLAKEIA